jgi:DNA-binding CsgD family transcriptional regulator
MTTERRPRGRPPHPDILTPREWQVLELLRQRLTNEQIAQRLDISLAGAKYHVSEILTKLGLTSREEAAAWQPEPAPARRWWALGFGWAARRAWPLAGAAAALAAGGALAWFILGASAGDEGDTVQTQASPSSAASPTSNVSPTPQDVTFAPLSVSNPQDTKLLFIRGAEDYLGPGSLWMSDLDGASPQVLVEDTVVGVIGVAPHWETGNSSAYYYTTEDIPEPTPNEQFRRRVTLSHIDLVTAERAEVLTFNIWGSQFEGAADITADGRYLAYTDDHGLSIRELASGESRRVLGMEKPLVLCRGEVWDTFQCNSFGFPQWSPDGSMLIAFQGASEGGRLFLLDPFVENPTPARLDVDAWQAQWSPSGESFCMVDRADYDEAYGVVVARSPDWQPQRFLSEHVPSLNTPVHVDSERLVHCVWLDDRRISLLFSANLASSQSAIRELLILDTETGDVRSLPEHQEWASGRWLLAIEKRDLVISQSHTSARYADLVGEATTPEIVDPETGARQAILTTEDWVVAAVPAEILVR